MKKLNIRIPRLTDKSISRKYFLFLFVCVAFFASGFFVNKAHAETEVIEEETTPVSEIINGENDSSVPLIISPSSETPVGGEEVILKENIDDVNDEVNGDDISSDQTTQNIIAPNDIIDKNETTIIDGDTTWKTKDSPYIFSDDVIVETGATLTIEPGVVVKMENSASLVVHGSVMALGTFENPIYFTSTADDTLGGDTNYDEDDTVPSSGDWYGIIITSESDDPNIDNLTQESSILNYVISRYSGGGLLVSDKNVTSEGLDMEEKVSLFNSNSTFDKLSTTMFNLYEGSTVTVNNSKINCTGEYSNGVSLSDASKLDISNSTVSIDNPDASNGILASNGSALSLDNVEINIIGNDWIRGLIIFDEGTTLDMKSSSITSSGNGLFIYADPGENVKATIDDSIFECAGARCIEGYNSSILMTNSKVSGATGFGVFYVGEPKTTQECSTDGYDENGELIELCVYVILPSSVEFELNNNEIFNNNVGINSYGGKVIGKKNSIHDNTLGAFNLTPEQGGDIVDLRNNYWGDKTGPKNLTTNPAGLGNEVTDSVLYSPFLKLDPLIVTKNPVIIIPGIMGTQLIRDYGDESEIWPDISRVIGSLSDNFLRELELLPNADENLDFPMKVGDIIRDTPAGDIFSGFIADLTNNGGYIEGKDLFVFPYDWQFSSTKNAELLKEKIDQILNDTEKEKVDIVAHSMGGLLAKEYIKENGKDKINHLIFLGTPHLGAPKAFKALVYGDDMGIKELGISLLNSRMVKAISQNMPSIFELLPPSEYVTNLRYISEKIFGGDPTYLDYDQTKKLLVEEGKNENLVQSADTFHQGIDEMDLSGINVSNISACGEATLSAINIRKKYNVGPFSFSEDYKVDYTNGDGTVPLDSSSGILNVSKYFVDKVGHSALPSIEDVPDTILDILGDKEVLHGGKVFVGINNCTPINGVILSVHSPITLDLYDEKGNHSGFDANDNLENNIPGVSYDTIGEAKFAFIPDGVKVSVKGNATGSGSFDLAIEKVIDGKTIETKFWNDVAITYTSQMNFDFNSYESINVIEMDNNGIKTNVPNSNILSEGEDYLAVSNKIIETNNHNKGGSSIINNFKNIVVKSDTNVEPNASQSKVNSIDIKKQKLTKKPLATLNQKEIISKQETVKSTPLVSTNSATRHKLGIWDTMKLFIKWLLNIFK